MKSWKVVLSGRFRRMLIFYSGLGSLVIGYLLATGGFRRMGTSDLEPEIGLVMVLVMFPIWAPVLFVTMSRLIKAKIPTSIDISSDNRLIRITYSKRKIEKIDFDQLGYSKADSFGNYVCLTLYKTFIGTRGQLVTKKLTELIGLKRTLSWKKHQVFEIIAELERNEILEIQTKNRELPLWERLI